MASYLITGTSRGFGLALVHELATLPASDISKIFATARGDAPSLTELVKKSSGRVIFIQLDVTDEASIKKAAAEVEANLAGKGLDVLINNAGVCQYAFEGVQSMDNLAESFTINVLGVHWTTQAFLPLLKKGTQKKVVNMSTTTLASITDAAKAHYLPAPAYKISKAAMHSLTVQYALDFEKEGFTFMALSPGWMKTDLGGGEMADLTAEQGAKASLDMIFKPGQELNGQYPRVHVKGWENAERNQYDGKNAPCVETSSLPTYKRLLQSSQEKGLAVAALRAIDGVTQLHNLLGGPQTRFAGFVASTFEAAVVLVCLCMDPSFPRDNHHTNPPPPAAVDNHEDPLQMGIRNVTRQGCLQVVQGALKRLQTLAEVSSMADIGASTLTLLLGKLSETTTKTSPATNEVPLSQNHELDNRSASTATMTKPTSSRLAAVPPAGEIANWLHYEPVDFDERLHVNE
ncbi:MAG: hypothetical protein Q9226_007464 [Calogaya cf. arnoldii]